MAHGYRILQHWNEWLVNEKLGHALLHAEEEILTPLLAKHLGKHVLLAGVSQQFQLLRATPVPIKSIVSPLAYKGHHLNYIESDLHELPISTGSIDLVIIPHTLQLIDRSRQLLNEACRIIKPEGMIAILGFNPYSFWGIKKMLMRHKKVPWSGYFIDAYNIKNWLQLAEFAMEHHSSCLFRPPITNTKIFNKLKFLDYIGSKVFPKLGGVYLVLARAKVIPFTPIRMHWKQQLSGVRTSSVTGHIRSSISTSKL